MGTHWTIEPPPSFVLTPAMYLLMEDGVTPIYLEDGFSVFIMEDATGASNWVVKPPPPLT
jgi:hypothetical protein